MKENAPSSSVQQLRKWTPMLVLAATLLITGVAWFAVRSMADTNDELEFQGTTQRMMNSLQRRTNTSIALLRAAAGLFASSSEVSLSQFRAFVRNLELRGQHPGVQGIGYAQRTPLELLDSINMRLQTEQGSRHSVFPPGERTEYYPVLYLEPLDERNRPSLGFDMFSDPEHRKAMETARDSGREAATGNIPLTHELTGEKRSGFIIFMPLYEGVALPPSVEKRRERLIGFVYSPFRVDDLLQDVSGGDSLHEVDIMVYDGLDTSAAALLHTSRTFMTEPQSGYEPRYTYLTTIDVAGRKWTIEFVTRPEFEETSGREVEPYILIGGVITALILFAATHAEARARDLAERRAAELRVSEAALRESESRLRRMMESNVLGITIAAPDGRIVEANDSFLEMLGYTREDLTAGRLNMLDRTPDEFREVDESARALMKEGTNHKPYEKKLLRCDGSGIPVLVGTAYLGGPEELAAGMFIDLTDAKAAEREIQRLNEELEQRVITRTAQLEASNKELESFAYSVAHDLRSPLRAIDGYAKFLLDDYGDRLDDEGRSYLHRSRAASQRLGQLIDDLLDLSRVSRVEMQIQTVDLSSIARRIAADLRGSDHDRKVEFVIAPGITARGDERLLELVMQNLLGNAWKFTARVPEARIEFNSTVVDGKEAYYIRDNGAGFDMSYVDKLFRTFHRVHSPAEFPGTGIGLATVHRVIERHVGKVWAEGEVDKGATFYFSL